ncbi:hypothetical protein [Streptomyces sp. NPDC005423]|uniref:hypothetical protein n=1 Tax=Streptomyces sp. NPDC005423 TaxID=3155343 RepID=UPI0033B5AF11
MTRTDTGSDDDTASHEPRGEHGRSANRNRILIASIGAAAVVAAAAVGALLADNGGTGGTPAATTLEVSTPTTATTAADACDLQRLADSWDRPPSQRYNESLFAGREAPTVYTQVAGADNDPEINVRGQVSLDIPAGQVLYLITRPDPDSKDQYGHSGNGRFYPGTPISPTSSGCWEDDNHRVGYPGVKGISETYLLVLVGADQAAKFPADRRAKNWDGYNAEQWRAISKIDVMNFHVSTA